MKPAKPFSGFAFPFLVSQTAIYSSCCKNNISFRSSLHSIWSRPHPHTFHRQGQLSSIRPVSSCPYLLLWSALRFPNCSFYVQNTTHDIYKPKFSLCNAACIYYIDSKCYHLAYLSGDLSNVSLHLLEQKLYRLPLYALLNLVYCTPIPHIGSFIFTPISS